MNRSLVRLLALGGALLTISTAQASTESRTYLNVGDPAPALRPAKWLKGTPTTSFATGKVYVVEFWATWCAPCKENIPHLTELAAKYGDKVSVNGISIFESNDPKSTGYLKKVETFVRDQGDRMVYNVAVDGPEGAVGKSWMKAADENGLPTSFIVGKDGRIAWIGHPKDLDSVLTQIVDDQFDVAAARARRAKEVETVRPIREAMEAKEFARAVKLIDAAVAKKPEEERLYTYDRLVALFHANPTTAMKESDAIIESSNGDIGAFRMIASIFASQKDLTRPVYVYGKGVISLALDKDEMTYLFQAMAAEVNASLGDYAGAVAMQEQAVNTAEGDSHAPREFVEFLRKNLEGFRAKLKAQPKGKSK